MAKINSQRKGVRIRLERKIMVLKEWLADGIPDGQVPPASLRQLAAWTDEALKLETISSPNEMTRTGRHGGLVRQAEEILLRLRERRPLPSRYSKERNLESLRTKLAAEKGTVASLVSRLEEARAEVLKLSRAKTQLEQRAERAEADIEGFILLVEASNRAAIGFAN